ncbi:unnamed protein product [Rotaria sp. Silwood1]|nr:unnamed protein product [Rotaria sp. Silwood1]CAF4503059.1 unnamed protein product [Rotaria sp. Silwood1]
MKILIDTGAQYSFINEKCLKLFNQFKYSAIGHQKFFMADVLTYFIVTGIIYLNITIGDVITSIPAFIVIPIYTETIPVDFPVKLSRSIKILPRSKQQIPVTVNISTATLPFRPSSNFIQKTSIYVPHSILNIRNYSTLLTVSNLSNSPRYLPKGTVIGIATYNNSDSYNITDNKNSITPNTCNSASQQINTITTPPPLPTTQQTISNLLFHIADQTQRDLIQSLLFKFQSTFDTTGLIRESQSPYAAPALLVKKKDQTWRLVIDYKKLNAITIKDNYPLPNMEATLQTLGAGYHYFSKLDLKFGFWQLPINEKDRFKTAFITPFGLFEWLVLPQGLRNSPPSFQRIMNNVLGAYSEFCLVYLDDIIIFSKDFNQHLNHIEQVLNASKSHNLILNPAKCEIAKQQIEYLGHVITPTTITQANRFIGALSWYRKFIPNFSSIAAPIHAVTNLTKHNRHKFKWGYEQSKSFNELKQLLTSTPLFLNFPDDTHPVLLSTDASKIGFGGILYQEINNVRKVLYYHSELLSPSQTRYNPMELEALAIFKCITRMRSFLLGQFNIQQIIHVKGKYNCLPDYLSRHPIASDDELPDDYGLGFTKDKSSSIQLLGVVVTRSKAKLLSHNIDSTSSSS